MTIVESKFTFLLINNYLYNFDLSENLITPRITPRFLLSFQRIVWIFLNTVSYINYRITLFHGR